MLRKNVPYWQEPLSRAPLGSDGSTPSCAIIAERLGIKGCVSRTESASDIHLAWI
jgi:hypothetical protein